MMSEDELDKMQGSYKPFYCRYSLLEVLFLTFLQCKQISTRSFFRRWNWTCKQPAVRPAKSDSISFHVRYSFTFATSSVFSYGVQGEFGPTLLCDFVWQSRLDLSLKPFPQSEHFSFCCTPLRQGLDQPASEKGLARVVGEAEAVVVRLQLFVGDCDSSWLASRTCNCNCFIAEWGRMIGSYFCAWDVFFWYVFAIQEVWNVYTVLALLYVKI